MTMEIQPDAPAPSTRSFNRKRINLAKKVMAEFVGTFVMIFVGVATTVVNQQHGALTLIGLAFSAGLTVMIVITSVRPISGAHLNPAITIAFASRRQFPWTQVPVYIAAQTLASIAASFLVKAIDHHIMAGVTVPSVSLGGTFVWEFSISFSLMFVVTAVSTDPGVGQLGGLLVGATVIVNILLAGPLTGASMNPVRTLGPAIAAKSYKGIWVYLTAPIVGAFCGSLTFSLLNLPKEEEE